MATGGKLRVLIVEDDALLRRALAHALTADGVEIVQFSDGQQAVDSIADQPPDLILSDYRLPGANGLEILDCLKQHQPSSPFILMTAYLSERLAQEAAAHGAVAVFEKPIDLAQLKGCCAKLLGRRSETAADTESAQ